MTELFFQGGSEIDRRDLESHLSSLCQLENVDVCSKDYRDLITAYNLKQSMSRKGNCWDNACVESFFHSMKVEAIQYEPIMTRDEMRQTVFEYIEVDYNRTRRHSALGYLSPVNFEQQNVA